MDKNCFVSWSGGKDSCLALYKAIDKGYNPKILFTMFSIENGVSTAHRLKEKIIKAQANAIGIDYCIGKTSFKGYEDVFVSNIREFKKQGIEYGIFGDIDIDEHREWEERVCKKASINPVLPLWKRDRKELVLEFLSLGFKAKIVLVDRTMMDTRFLGQDLSSSLLDEIEEYGADPCGENGEYHTVVYDGPIFKEPANIKFDYNFITIENRWVQINVDI